MSEKKTDWRIVRDPARPNWPGCLLVPLESNGKHSTCTVISVQDGEPANCFDSQVLAARIQTALSGPRESGSSDISHAVSGDDSGGPESIRRYTPNEIISRCFSPDDSKWVSDEDVTGLLKEVHSLRCWRLHDATNYRELYSASVRFEACAQVLYDALADILGREVATCSHDEDYDAGCIWCAGRDALRKTEARG